MVQWYIWNTSYTQKTKGVRFRPLKVLKGVLMVSLLHIYLYHIYMHWHAAHLNTTLMSRQKETKLLIIEPINLPGMIGKGLYVVKTWLISLGIKALHDPAPNKMDNKIVTVNLKDSKGSIFTLAVPKDTAEKMKNGEQTAELFNL